MSAPFKDGENRRIEVTRRRFSVEFLNLLSRKDHDIDYAYESRIKAAYPLHRSLTPLGVYLRRMKAKLGPAGATMATARKIAVIFYTMVTRQVEFDESIWAHQDQERQKRLEARLRRQAQKLGYQLVPLAS